MLLQRVLALALLAAVAAAAAAAAAGAAFEGDDAINAVRQLQASSSSSPLPPPPHHHHRRFLRSSPPSPSTDKQPPRPTTTAATVIPLELDPRFLFIYLARLRLPGGQSAPVLLDTGSSKLFLGTTACLECGEALVPRASSSSSRQQPPAAAPLVDLAKAQAVALGCGDPRCHGVCREEALKAVAGDDGQQACGPHSGVCWWEPVLPPPGSVSGGGVSGGADRQCMFIHGFGTSEAATQIWGQLVVGEVELGGNSGRHRVRNMTWGAVKGGDAFFVQDPGAVGILGMAPATSCDLPFSSCLPAFLERLAEETGAPPTFAVCGSSTKPALVLGGGDDRLFEGNITYVPHAPGVTGQYVVGIEGVSLGGTELLPPQAVAGPSGVRTLVDTGTTRLVVPTAVMAAFRATLLGDPALCAEVPYLCPTEARPRALLSTNGSFPFRPADLAKLPPLRVQLSSDISGLPVVLEMRGEDYVVRTRQPAGTAVDSSNAAEDGTELFELAVSATADPGAFILGQALLRRYYVEFDRASAPPRVGFAVAVPDCQKAAGL